MKIEKNTYQAGVALLMTVVATYVLAALSLICGIASCPAVYPFIFPVAILLSLAFVSGQRQICFFGVSIIICLLLGIATYDFSWDGIMYHQEIIALLLDGWNPFNSANLTPENSIWANHYAKGIEICASAIAATFNSIEIGKAVNYLLFASIIFMVWSVVSGNFPKWNILKKSLITLAIVGNPVVIGQVPTYYIDYTKYIYILWTLILIYNLASNSSLRNSIALSGVLILSIATKFNICFEEVLWCIFALISLLITRHRRPAIKLLLIGVISAIVGLALTWHPYITNYIIAGNMFYPLLGEGNVDIMTDITPEIFGNGRFVDFFKSIFTISLPTNETRAGGFGPFMPIILLISLYISVRDWRQINTATKSILLFCLLTCFLFEQSWWARYICQLWLIPAIILLISFKISKTRIASQILLWCMLLSIPISMIYILRSTRAVDQYRTALYETLAADNSGNIAGDTVKLVNAMPQFKRALNEQGISYQCVEEIPSEDYGEIIYLFTSGNIDDDTPYPLLVLSENQTARFHKNMKKRGIDVEYYIYQHDKKPD